ncbi:LamG-like jellyroll fold domain-containing protein [Frigoribacterium sp. UYMn621]|uniref:CBM96 family carbohydrate-binding protein n=1 Tax=Frigoribacterium sp. UYMn621 TaxID=3156343 RepID=UPI00339579C3
MPASALTPGVAFSAADLATWQTNGVVYATGTVSGKVLAGGTFSQISPPTGGSGTTQARNALAIFNAETGAPDSCQYTLAFSGGTPSVRSIVAAPGSTTIFIGGDFTSINGVAVARLAALDPISCTIKPFRTPGIGGSVLGLAVTDSTVFLAGQFTTVASQGRDRLAAVNSSTGALLPWAPDADGIARAVAVSPDGTKVAVGGDFYNVNGNDSHAIAVVDSTTGATVRNYPVDRGNPSAMTYSQSGTGAVPTWQQNTVVKVITTDAASNSFYVGNEGTGGGVFDGRTALSWDTLDQRWHDTCLGATQALEVYQGTLYIASHAHDCSSNNAFGDGKRNFFMAQSTTDASILQWFPTANDGIGEGIGPRALTIATGATTGKKYLWFGGEFTQVNGHTQQALTRFGPDDVTVPPTPAIAAEALTSNAVQVRFRTVVDPDDGVLTYNVYRNGGTTPIWSGTASSYWWSRPQVTFVDTNVTPGTLYTYRVSATDGINTSTLSGSVGARPATKAANYPSTVISDGANLYWRFDETTTPWVQDKSGVTAPAVAKTSGLNGLYQNGIALNAPGAIAGDSDTAAVFNGTDGYVYSDQQKLGPTTYSIETWIKTTTTSGGKIIGYGSGIPKTNNSAATLSGSYDRQVYMDNSGRLTFGIYSGGVSAIRSANAYNDGTWHHIVATQGSAGMKLFVDGVKVGQNAVSANQSYLGNWHVGGDNMSGWPNQPSSNYFGGTIDDTAVYPNVLSAQQVANHYQLAGGSITVPVAPADVYGAKVFSQSPDVYWRLDDTSGTTAKDASFAAQSDGTYGSGVTLAQGAGIQTGTGVTVDGTQAGLISTKVAAGASAQVSEEAWVKTGTTSGGKIVGFEDSATGTGNNYDKQIYMTNDGRLIYGVYVGGVRYAETSASYNDNLWHHVVGTLGLDGLKLYVDGALVGSDSITASQSFDGYWRAGGGNLNGWPDQPSSFFLNGSLDEVAVYPIQLSASDVLNHFQLGTNQAPDTEAPSVVTGVTGTAAGSSASVTWAAASDNVAVTGYSVYRGTTSGFTADSSSKVADTTSASYSDPTLAVGTYFYKVTATDAAGNMSAASAASAGVAIADSTPPTAPTAVTASVSGASVSLNWTASTDDVGVTGYSVHRGNSADFTAGAANKIANVATTSYLDSNLGAGTYYYRVVALDAASNASAASDVASAVVTDSTAPTAPSGVTATATGTSVAVEWTASTDNVGVAGYTVYRGTTSGFTADASSKIADASGTSYADTAPGAGTFFYQVTAKDAAGNVSAASSSASVSIADTTAPTVPSGLTATVAGSTVTLSWTASTDDVAVTGYSVYRGASAGFTADASTRIGGATSPSYVDSGLAVGTYYYRVVALDAASNASAASDVASAVVTDSTAPTAPSGVTATATGTSVAVEWTASTDNVGVAGYTVYRGTTSGFTADASSKIADASGTSYADTAPGAGTFFYQVTAKDAAGNVSAASSSASVSIADTTAPTVPSGLTATFAGSTVTLSWTASTDDVAVTGYSVYRGASAGFTADASTRIGGATSPSYVDSGLAVGTYYYRVVALDAASNASAASDSASVTVVTPPGQTTTLTVNPTEDAATYGAAPTKNYGTDNQLSSRGTGTNSPISSYLKFAIPAAPDGTTLTGASLRVRTSTDATAASADAHTFSIVTGTWSAASVTWNTRPTGAGPLLGVLTGASATNTNYTVALDATQLAGLVGTTASFSETSTGSDNVRLWSNDSTNAAYRPLLTLTYTAGITPPPSPDTVAPTVPTAVAATSPSAGSVMVNWTASTDNVGVAGYTVYRGASADFVTNSGSKVTDVASTSITQSSVSAGTYFYKVIAVDAAGNASAASSAASVTVAPVTTPPTVLTVNATEDSMAYQVLPTTNFGSDQQLSSRGPISGASIVSYLKFAVPMAPAGSSLSGATLQVRTSTDPSAGSGDAHDLSVVTGQWTESTITWDTRPTGAGPSLGTLTGATGVNAIYTVVLSVEQVAALAGTTVTMAMSSAGTDNLRLWSTNASTVAYRPVLSLTYSY